MSLVGVVRHDPAAHYGSTPRADADDGDRVFDCASFAAGTVRGNAEGSSLVGACCVQCDSDDPDDGYDDDVTALLGGARGDIVGGGDGVGSPRPHIHMYIVGWYLARRSCDEMMLSASWLQLVSHSSGGEFGSCQGQEGHHDRQLRLDANSNSAGLAVADFFSKEVASTKFRTSAA
eukprot:4882892-Pyramimonas_sp.AAC.1